MTEQLFLQDSYLQEFETEVSSCDHEQNAILPAATAFYPGGGGQPPDQGVLLFADRSLPVTGFKKGPDGIYHLVAGELPVPGTRIKGIIDWPRRYAIMRTHTALHILSAVVWRDYGAQVTGGNIEPLSGRLDFELESLSAELVEEIQRKVNLEVEQNHPISARVLPRAEAERIPDLIRTKINLLPPSLQKIRIVEIAGLDLQADGGTHVHSTAEVGRIRIVKYKSKGRINKRMQIELDL